MTPAMQETTSRPSGGAQELQAIPCIDVRLATPYLASRRQRCHPRRYRRRSAYRLLLKPREPSAAPPTPTNTLTCASRSTTHRPLDVVSPIGACVFERYREAQAACLEYVRLSGASWTDVSPDIGQSFPSLQCLDLSDNQISSLAPLAALSLLRRLDVASNTIHTLSDLPLDAFRFLETLDVSYNHLDAEGLFAKEAPLGHLPRLRHLSSSGNGLKHIPPVCAPFPRLTDLCLSHNALTGLDLTRLLLSIQTLRNVDCEHNRIGVLSGTAVCVITIVHDLSCSRSSNSSNSQTAFICEPRGEPMSEDRLCHTARSPKPSSHFVLLSSPERHPTRIQKRPKPSRERR